MTAINPSAAHNVNILNFITTAREQVGPEPKTLTRGLLNEACMHLESEHARASALAEQVEALRAALRMIDERLDRCDTATAHGIARAALAAGGEK